MLRLPGMNTLRDWQLQEAFRKHQMENVPGFCAGEQGVGKTFVDTFLAKFKFRLSVTYTCVQMACHEPFLPLLEALERRCRESKGRLLIERLNHLAPTLLFQMLNVLDSDELARLQMKVAHINTGHMLREGAYFFETLSDTHPLY